MLEVIRVVVINIYPSVLDKGHRTSGAVRATSNYWVTNLEKSDKSASTYMYMTLHFVTSPS